MKKIIISIALILCVVILFSFMARIIDFGSSPGSTVGGSSSGSSGGGSSSGSSGDSDNSDSVIQDPKPEIVGEFTGSNAIALEAPGYWIENPDNVGISVLDYINEDLEDLNAVSCSDGVTVNNVFATIDFKPLTLSNYTYIVIDFDMEQVINTMGETDYPVLNFEFTLADSNNVKYNGLDCYVTPVSDETHGENFILRSLNNPDRILAIDDDVRITYIIKIDSTDPSLSSANLYVNGEFCFFSSNIVPEGVTDIAHLYIDNITNSSGTTGCIGFKNFNVNYYDAGAIGTINSLWKRTLTFEQCGDIKRFTK